MSDEEFLARWSRRKSEARTNAALPQKAEAGYPSGNPSPAPPSSAAKESVAQDKEDEFDPSSLPPIDAITAATDITAYLHKGIPRELTRAALRRAWTADPAIRDFVGLAENAWDFNDPTAMPGFGPLDCSETELAEWVDRIIGSARRAAESLPVEPKDPENELSENAVPSQPETSGAAVADGVIAAPVAVQPGTDEVDEDIEREINRASAQRRRHGGALPR